MPRAAVGPAWPAAGWAPRRAPGPPAAGARRQLTAKAETSTDGAAGETGEGSAAEGPDAGGSAEEGRGVEADGQPVPDRRGQIAPASPREPCTWRLGVGSRVAEPAQAGAG